MEDKTYQLENTLSQLEKAELKAAKEARQRLELERTLRRFKNPGAASSSATLHDLAAEDAGSELDGAKPRPPTVIGSRLASNRSMQSMSGSGASTSKAASFLGGRSDRPSRLDASNDLASVTSASYGAAEEFDATHDLPSPAQLRGGSVHSTPLVRTALLRGATPDSQSRRFFPSGTNTANSSVASMQHHSQQQQHLQQQQQQHQHQAESRSVARSYTSASSLSGRPPHAPEAQEMGERVYAHSAASTVRSTFSSPDNSPEPASLAASARNLNRSLESVAPGASSSGRAFDRAFQATSRIEQAMKAKGWKVDK